MTITSSTPLTRVVISIETAFGGLRNLAFTTDETPQARGYIYLAGPAPASGSDEHTNYAALRDMYPDFVDANGDSITIVVSRGAAFGLTTFEEVVERHGNPFTQDYFEARANLKAVQVAFEQHGEVEEDGTTENREVATTGGIVPKPGAPASGTLPVPLEDFEVVQFSDALDEFHLRLYPRGGVVFSGNYLAKDERNRGLVQWMADERTGGDIVYTGDLDDIHTGFGGASGTEIEFSPAAGTTIRCTTAGVSPNADYVNFAFDIDADSGTFRLQQVADYFYEKVVNIATALEQGRPRFGSTEVPTRGESFRFPRGVLRFERSALTVVSAGGDRTILGSAFGKAISTDDLPIGQVLVAGAYPSPVPAPFERNNVGAIHHTGSGTQRIRFFHPSEYLPHAGMFHEVEIHRAPSAGAVHIYDGNGDLAFSLLQGEFVRFRAIWHADGTSELQTVGHVDRVMEIAGNNAGDLGDVNRFLSTKRYYPFPRPSGSGLSTSIRHADTFGPPGTDTFSTDDALSNLHLPQTVPLLKAGKLRTEFAVSIRTGSSGNLPNGHGICVVLNGAELDTSRIQYRITGTNKNRTWFFVREDDVEVDDRFTVMYRTETYQSMPADQIQIAYYRLRHTLEHRLSVDDA